MAKRILVPLDQTPEAEAVLPLIGDAARGGGATMRLLYVAPTPDNVVDADGHIVAYADQETARMEAEALDYLRTVEARLDGIPVESAVRFGDPAEEILLEADAVNADLIALTARGRRHWLGGGTSAQIGRRAATAVVIYRLAGHGNS